MIQCFLLRNFMINRCAPLRFGFRNRCRRWFCFRFRYRCFCLRLFGFYNRGARNLFEGGSLGGYFQHLANGKTFVVIDIVVVRQHAAVHLIHTPDAAQVFFWPDCMHFHRLDRLLRPCKKRRQEKYEQ